VRELTGQLTPEELRPPGVSQNVALDEYDPRTMKFFELALTPDSAQIGRTVRQLHLERDHGAVAVAVQRSGRHTRNRVATMRLRSGDVVLAFGDERSRTSLRRSPDYHMIEGVDEVVYRTERMPHALVITAGLLLTLVTGTLDPCIAGLAAALLFVATGCLNVNQALDTIPWPILIFIGGTVALSQASGDAGTTARIGGALVDVLGGYGPPVIVAGLFIGALILTEFLSNNAMAVIMTPIAIEAARVADGDPRVFALAIAFGASASFANPLDYTTNLIVFGQGGYRVRDFLKVGIPMNLLVGTAGVIAMWVAYRP
jgi:di/tricarboxylate transporter